MFTARLQQRVSSATPVRIAKLLNHSLRFHKRSNKDGSGKADAYFTGEPEHVVWGVIFQIAGDQSPLWTYTRALAMAIAKRR
jgi:hypothetical protein